MIKKQLQFFVHFNAVDYLRMQFKLNGCHQFSNRFRWNNI